MGVNLVLWGEPNGSIVSQAFGLRGIENACDDIC